MLDEYCIADGIADVDYPDERLHRRFQVVVRAIGSSSRVLDIACGSGTLMEALRAKGCDVVGIDINPGAIRLAKGKGLNAVVGNVDAFHSDHVVRDLIFSDYDAVIFSKCLMHLRRKNELFRQLRARRLFVIQANPLHWGIRWRRWRDGDQASKNPYVTADGETVNDKTIGGMRRWAQSYGYQLSILHGGLLRSRNAVFELTR
jgi:SAM-dependent methyltransferase